MMNNISIESHQFLPSVLPS